ncbi:MAG: sugar nucleotide-binding protein, partial [Bacteroidota bacterium]
DGNKQTPYTETDGPKPINIYGASKLAGEQAIQTIDADHMILRTSWVYGSRGNNFLLTMLKLMKERENLRIINDQRGTPSWARLIAETTAHIVKQSLLERQQKTFQSGLYHLTSSGQTTWHGFAEKIKSIAQSQNKRDVLKIRDISPITTCEYPTPAKRPMNSSMSINKLQDKYNLTMPSWDASLELCMEEMS